MINGKNKVSYAGIPAKHRAQVAKIMHLDAAGLAFLPGTRRTSRTPQHAWKMLQEHWAQEKEMEEKKARDRAKRITKQTREGALESLDPVLDQLGDVRDMAYALEHGEASYLDHHVQGRLLRLAIIEIGTTLEQALRDLRLIPVTEYGYFVDDVKLENMETATEVSHG